MNLTWHIAKKDLRRMALPVGLWVAFVMLATVGFRRASVGDENSGPAEIGAWIATLSTWSRLLVAGGWLVSYLLAGALSLEDGLRGTNGFWMTRPVSGARLLVAKLTAVALLLVVAPTAGLAAVWVSCGFGFQGVCHAAVDFACWQTTAALPAVAVASLAGSLAEFIFCSTGLAVALGVGLVLPTSIASGGVYQSRTVLLYAGMALAIGAVLTHQFLTRRTARTWGLVTVMVAAGLAIRLAWPWDFWTDLREKLPLHQRDERTEDRLADLSVSLPSGRERFENETAEMSVTAPWTKGGFSMPVQASLDLERREVTFKMFNGWQETGERAIGFKSAEGPVVWRLIAAEPRSVLFSGEPPGRLNGRLELWSARVRSLGEMPLRVGGECSSGALRARIVGLQHTGEQLDGIFVENHDVFETDIALRRTPTTTAQPEATGYLDGYFLVDRAGHEVQALSATDLGAVNMNLLGTSVRRLVVGGTKSWAGAVVLVMRIERDHAFTRPFSVTTGPTDPSEAQP